MTYIYIDESGDLGFTKKGSRYFIIASVKINDEKTNALFKRIPKKMRQKVLKKKEKKLGELKFSNSSALIRERFLKRAAQLPIEVYAVIIEKRLTEKDLQNNLPVLYNYLLKIVLEKSLGNVNIKQRLHICLDKAMSSSQRENFETYVQTEFLSLFQTLPEITIKHEISEGNECLQVVDFVCGAFGYKYNTAQLKEGCTRYTELVKERIRVEKADLFKEKATRAYLS
jgi:hypothetical protein